MNVAGPPGQPQAVVEFYCPCRARLVAPAGTPSVTCPACGGVVVVPPPAAALAMAAPVATKAPGKGRRYIVSGVLGIGMGAGAFVVREVIKSSIQQSPEAMLEVAFNPRAAQGVIQALQWCTYIGVGLLVIGGAYLIAGLVAQQR